LIASQSAIDRPWYRRLNLAGIMLVSVTIVAYLLLYLPSVVMGIMSLNTAPVPVFPLQGYTTEWYSALFANAAIQEAVVNSALIAAATLAIALPIGTAAAFALVRGRFRGRNVVFTVVLLPILTPALVLAVALLIFYQWTGVGPGVAQVVAGHVLVAIPYVVLIVAARLFGFDRTIEYAALDLGASPVRTLWWVTLPVLGPALMAAGMFAFLLSWDELLVAFFNIDVQNTLPTFIWASLRHSITYETLALGTLLSLATAVLVVMVWLTMWRRSRKAAPRRAG